MKPYIGQVICNDEGKIMGTIVRIHEHAPGEFTLFHVPVFTNIGFGNMKFYRSESGEVLEL